MNQKQSFRIFNSKKFLFIESIFIVLFEAGRLLASSDLLNVWCGNGTRPTCAGNACTTVIYAPSCSRFIGELGMKIFLLSFIVGLVSFLTYKIFKKDFKNSILPIIGVVAVFLIADWILGNLFL